MFDESKLIFVFSMLRALRVSEICLIFIFLLYDSESERAERERKGDLDQYERLDGDRNQTSKYIAVKKVVLVHFFPLKQTCVFCFLNYFVIIYKRKFEQISCC